MRASLHAFGAVTAALALAATVASAAGAATVDVQIRDFAFGPDYVLVAPGDEVRWLQGGSTIHTVTSRVGAPERFDSEVLPGQELRRVFRVAGRHPYHCTIHPEMRGVVQVGPDTTAPALTRVIGKTGPRRLRVSFRLSEEARVSVELVRRGKAVRRSRARTVDQGARSAAVSVSDLAEGRYRVRVRAVDVAGNVATARGGSVAIARS